MKILGLKSKMDFELTSSNTRETLNMLIDLVDNGENFAENFIDEIVTFVTKKRNLYRNQPTILRENSENVTRIFDIITINNNMKSKDITKILKILANKKIYSAYSSGYDHFNLSFKWIDNYKKHGKKLTSAQENLLQSLGYNQPIIIPDVEVKESFVFKTNDDAMFFEEYISEDNYYDEYSDLQKKIFKTEVFKQIDRPNRPPTAWMEPHNHLKSSLKRKYPTIFGYSNKKYDEAVIKYNL